MTGQNYYGTEVTLRNPYFPHVSSINTYRIGSSSISSGPPIGPTSSPMDCVLLAGHASKQPKKQSTKSSVYSQKALRMGLLQGSIPSHGISTGHSGTVFCIGTRSHTHERQNKLLVVTEHRGDRSEFEKGVFRAIRFFRAKKMNIFRAAPLHIAYSLQHAASCIISHQHRFAAIGAS